MNLSILQANGRKEFEKDFGWMRTMSAGTELSNMDVDDVLNFLDTYAETIARAVMEECLPGMSFEQGFNQCRTFTETAFKRFLGEGEITK